MGSAMQAEASANWRLVKTRRLGDPAKFALAARWRAETMLTVGRMAERLEMGTRSHLHHRLYRWRKSGGKQP